MGLSGLGPGEAHPVEPRSRNQVVFSGLRARGSHPVRRPDPLQRPRGGPQTGSSPDGCPTGARRCPGCRAVELRLPRTGVGALGSDGLRRRTRGPHRGPWWPGDVDEAGDHPPAVSPPGSVRHRARRRTGRPASGGAPPGRPWPSPGSPQAGAGPTLGQAGVVRTLDPPGVGAAHAPITTSGGGPAGRPMR